MGSKVGMAGGIPERRVRPIWDAVDSRQFKNALKLTSSLLTKFPNSPYVLALKALIMERMGKPDEALTLCLNAKEHLFSNDAVQIDDLTLSTMQIVFQRLDHLELATSCYEYACGKFSNNLELMMGLFNCYVREYSYVKQQQTAIKMYKAVGEERFLLWAVCSIQLQVFYGDGGEKLLHLAEALLKKHIALHGLHEPEALLVYISVLEQQEKFGDALETLSGKLGSLLVIEVDRLRIQGRLLARACAYVAAAEIYQKVLILCPDDWESFLHYLDCLLEDDSGWLISNLPHQIHPSKFMDLDTCKLSQLTDELFDSRLSSASNFIQRLQTEVADDFVRCPFLANLEIEKRRRLYGKADDGKLMDFLFKYFCRFGHLACFTSDVETFLQVLKPDEKLELLEKCLKFCETPVALPLKALGQAITSFRIQEVMGAFYRLPPSELEGIAVKMAETYCKNLIFSKDLDPQENMHGEELLTLACNMLVQLFWRTHHLGYLLEAILVLEFGLTIRRFVWQYKILLVHLYSHWGALPQAYDWYKSLEIKNILLETVSHHIWPQMLRSTLWSDWNDLLKDYMKFMEDYFREAADLTFIAYRHRNYSKVIEFVKFRERLQHSYQYLMERIEAPILQLKQKADSVEEVESILKSFNFGIELLDLSSEEQRKSLTFNEDLQSRPWWSPTSDENCLLGPFKGDPFFPRGNMEKEERQWKAFERRFLLPRIIHLSIQCAPSSLKESIEINEPASNNMISSELRHLLEQYAVSMGLSFNDAIRAIIEISEGHRSFKDFKSSGIELINFAVFVNAWNSSSRSLGQSDGAVSISFDSWVTVDNLMEKCLMELLRTIQQPLSTYPESDLSFLVHMVTEAFAWHGLVIQSCIRSLLPSGSGKKKKRSGAPDHLLSTPLSEGIKNSIKCLCSLIEEVIKWSKEQIERPKDEVLDCLLSLIQSEGCDQGPGHVVSVLEAAVLNRSAELGHRICEALDSWSLVETVRKIIDGQQTMIRELYHICNSKLKSIERTKKLI